VNTAAAETTAPPAPPAPPEETTAPLGTVAVVVVIFVLLLQQDPPRAACERHRVCTAGRRRVFGCGCRLERVRARIEEARVLLAEAVDRMVCTRLVMVGGVGWVVGLEGGRVVLVWLGACWFVDVVAVVGGRN
jgi:hypothetical protein